MLSWKCQAFRNEQLMFWQYNLETVLAEKLETIITRTVTNTRMRDFYGVYNLQQFWAAYQKKFSYAADTDWSNAIDTVRGICT